MLFASGALGTTKLSIRKDGIMVELSENSVLRRTRIYSNFGCEISGFAPLPYTICVQGCAGLCRDMQGYAVCWCPTAYQAVSIKFMDLLHMHVHVYEGPLLRIHLFLVLVDIITGYVLYQRYSTVAHERISSRFDLDGQL